MMRASLDLTFSALADPTRRGVVGLLRRQPHRASDLADELGASKPAMSRHLKVLRATGLIAPADLPSDDARERAYQLVPEPFAQLRTWLDEVEQLWRVQLDAFKAHVECDVNAEAEPDSAPGRRGAGHRYAVAVTGSTHIAERRKRGKRRGGS